MNLLTTGRRAHWVFAALVALLLAANVSQAAHLHAEHGLAPDCVQCQAEGGQAMSVTEAVTLSCPPVSRIGHPDLVEAPVATFYRLAARGPPSLSS